MAIIHEQMLVDEYINSVLELDEQQFDEYFDSLSLEQQEELTEIIKNAEQEKVRITSQFRGRNIAIG